VGAAELLEARSGAFRTISWRAGTKGPLRAEFAAIRVRVADGPVAAGGRHLPGGEAWLVGERRATGERKCYLSDLPPDATLEALAALREAAIEARDHQRKVSREMENTAVGELKSAGMEVTELPAAEVEKMRERVQPVTEKHKREIGAELVDALYAEVAKVRGR